MDKYDYLEIVYRGLLFLVAASASFSILQLAIGAAKDQHHPGITLFAYGIMVTWAWVIFLVGVAAYTIFIAKGSFRPSDNEYIDELADIVEEVAEEVVEAEKND
jgi:hypothetical protein